MIFIGVRLSYQQLWDRRYIERDQSPIAKVFHLHIPKTAGNSVAAAFEQIGYERIRFDMNAAGFRSAKSSRALFTGHFRLDAAALRECEMPHVVITLLREPISRILSHYNHTLRVQGNPWHEQVRSGEMSFLKYAETFLQPESIGPQYSFFDETGRGSFAWSGKSHAKDCIENLFSRVSLYGFVDRIPEFTRIVRETLGVALPIVTENVTAEIESNVPLKSTLTPEENKAMVDMFDQDLYFYTVARTEYFDRVCP